MLTSCNPKNPPPYLLPPHSAGRRGSFIHLSDADDEDQQNVRSRASSMNSHIGDETYITPFAQVTVATPHCDFGVIQKEIPFSRPGLQSVKKAISLLS